MKISVIIPTLNESASIARLIKHLKKYGGNNIAEIIISDGGSADATVEISKLNGAIAIHSAIKGRASQMNYGSTFASGDIFYFVHADTLPPVTFVTDIFNAVATGNPAGCFAYKFDSEKRQLKFLSSYTRHKTIFTGGGDQTLFLTRNIFESVGGFNEQFILMEDFDIVKRLQKEFSFHIIQCDALVSARKYDHNSFIRVQVANFIVFTLYKLRVRPAHLKTIYHRMLNQYGMEAKK
ncbi:MAG: TIGR04283 family arsenosugar biosynthesis glycosyltransferase [Bacteroidia bacterium]